MKAAMPGEKEKMLSGALYDPRDALLSAERRRARLLSKAYNDTRDDQQAERAGLIRELIPASGDEIIIEPPFFCDYGTNITLGDRLFMNFNCVILDIAPVRIGSGVLFGPAVQIYAATHPLSARERRTGLESGKPVEIGDEVWIGGGAIVCPGVRVGAGSVIAAGSVVISDVPEGVLAAGNPCRVVREIEPGSRESGAG
jgi:maltose O-acetyltransferase